MVYSSVQHSVFGTVTASRPRVSPDCQTANRAPVGSVKPAIRPWVKTSNGAKRTVPPACSTALAVASASTVWKYTVHAEPAPGSVSGPAAATVFPSSVNIPYPPASGPADRNSQPNRAP